MHAGVGDRHLARMSSAMNKAKDPESRAAAHAAARKLTDALKLTSFQVKFSLFVQNCYISPQQDLHSIHFRVLFRDVHLRFQNCLAHNAERAG